MKREVTYEWRIVWADEGREVDHYWSLSDMPYTKADIESGLELSLTRSVIEEGSDWYKQDAWVENWKLWKHFDEDLDSIGAKVPERFQKELDTWLKNFKDSKTLSETYVEYNQRGHVNA